MAAVWMLLCVLTVCLARVSGFPAELSPNEISLKKAFALFQAMESMLERDAGEVLLHTHKVDEPLNGTMSDEQSLNGTMSDEAKFNGTMSDEEKLNGTMSDEAKLNGTMSDNQLYNATMSDEEKFNGTMSAEETFNTYNRLISSIKSALESLISEILS